MKKQKTENENTYQEKESQLLGMSGKTIEISTIGIDRFSVDINKGLSDEQVLEREEQGLINKVKTGSKKTILGILFSNIFSVFNIITFSVAFWLVSVESYKDLLFMVIVLTNIIIGIVQEIRAKMIIDKLSLLSSSKARVLRNGQEKDIEINELVLDDVILLEAGKEISADSIVKEGVIEVNESLLTGESDSLVKKKDMSLFSGSYVVSGRCKAQIEKVGKDNYIEKLASQAKVYKKPKSDLLRSLNIIIRVILVFLLPIAFFMFVIQMGASSGSFSTIWDGFDTMGKVIVGVYSRDSVEFLQYQEAVIKTSTSIIGMVPAGLFLATSIALAVGVIKLAKQKTLVQDLYGIETLARVNVLCLDKTGTITDGTMNVKGVEIIKNETGLSVKNIVSILQNSLEDKNMTSVALEQEFGRGKKIKSTFILPFSSVRKFSAASYEKYGTFFLGAPEFILKKNYSSIKKMVEKHAKKGYRVLLIGHSSKLMKNEDEWKKMKIDSLALILIEDTIREDAIETIEYFKDSGVDLKVISGDNPLTAAMVAKRAGIENTEQYISMEKIDDDSIKDIVDKYTVFGRVSPKQKQIIIQQLKKKGKTVAMTGDGVNDILALREADCSIAMASGSEATRNVAHLVLLDSNFSSMPKVVREGRRVINNIQRVATLFLTKTIFTFLLSSIIIYVNYVMRLPLSYPIELKQINVIELLIIGIPAVILAFEANNNQIKGRFMLNVLKTAFPGALVVIINFLALFFLQDSLNINAGILSTMSLIVTAFVVFMVLNRVCKPYNNLRRILFATMFISFALVITLPTSRDFLELSSLDIPQILLVSLLVVLTNPILDFLTKLPSNLAAFIREKMHFKRIKIILVEKERNR